MKGIPSFSISIFRIADCIHIYPTAYGTPFLVSIKSVKELKFNLENYVERMKLKVFKW